MGRVAGTDNLIIVLTMGVSTIAAGYILEEELVTLREILLVTGWCSWQWGRSGYCWPRLGRGRSSPLEQLRQPRRTTRGKAANRCR